MLVRSPRHQQLAHLLRGAGRHRPPRRRHHAGRHRHEHRPDQRTGRPARPRPTRAHRPGSVAGGRVHAVDPLRRGLPAAGGQRREGGHDHHNYHTSRRGFLSCGARTGSRRWLGIWPGRSGPSCARSDPRTERAYDHPDAVGLLQALYDEQVDRYGFADPVQADPAEYAPPRGLFLVAYVDGVPSACGGYRTHDRATATVELKKLYTVPELRRRLGRLVGARLEQHAADHGARRAILETGVRSHGALALVRLAGYQPTARYVAGRDPAINRAFVKDLSHLNRSSGRHDLRTTAQ